MNYMQAFNNIREPMLGVLKALRPFAIAADLIVCLMALGASYDAGWNGFFIIAAGVAAPIAVETLVLVTFWALHLTLPLIPMWRTRKGA